MSFSQDPSIYVMSFVTKGIPHLTLFLKKKKVKSRTSCTGGNRAHINTLSGFRAGHCLFFWPRGSSHVTWEYRAVRRTSCRCRTGTVSLHYGSSCGSSAEFGVSTLSHKCCTQTAWCLNGSWHGRLGDTCAWRSGRTGNSCTVSRQCAFACESLDYLYK